MNLTCKAVLFDTGGTVLDWHGSLVQALGALTPWPAGTVDAHAFVNEWRRRSMGGIVGQVRPPFDMDDVHRSALKATVEHFGLTPMPEPAATGLWQAWRRVSAWPDFAPALQRLRGTLPAVSFTMLPTSLVVDVSRHNGLTWDAIVSCQMIGIYKPHAEAYQTAVRWLGLGPADVLMVACHNFDLNAAQDQGMRTAFVRRPAEWGPAGPPDPWPNRVYDLVVDDFDTLVDGILGRETG
ncbi:haloacid dehalogenase type II [Rubrivivax albus]|nr:haloacid dehalogenase type II [Rubrivivax albus]